MSYTCSKCLEGQHRRCLEFRTCPCNICKVDRSKPPKPRKKYKQVRTRTPAEERKAGGVKPWTEREKDEIAESILKMYQGFVDKGCYIPAPPPPKKDHSSFVSQEEDDEICEMVVKLLQEIKRRQIS